MAGNRLSARGGIGGKGGLSFCGGNGGRGRIRIDSVVFSGRVPSVNGTLVKKNLTTLFFVSTVNCRYLAISESKVISNY